jgi:hypothetical protein
MRDIFDLADQTHINPREPYLRAYPYLVDYFSELDIGPSQVVRAAHMVYGWMPTILEMHWDQGDADLRASARTLVKVCSGEDAAASELELLASVVNKSLVGASKLLHFAAPSRYPIWDSRVYRFVHEEAPYHYRLNDTDAFLAYVAQVRAITADPRMPKLLTSVESKLGYKVTPVRAVELIMFIHGANGGGLLSR